MDLHKHKNSFLSAVHNNNKETWNEINKDNNDALVNV